jgi:DNA polymerase-4
VGHEFTFETDLVEIKTIQRELLELASMVAKRLRRYGLQGRTVTLKVKYHDFRRVTRSTTIKNHTADGRNIYREVLRLLDKTEAGRKPLRLLGISVSGLAADKGFRQRLIFQPVQTEERRREINRALDEIQQKYGATAILPARLLGGG